MQALVVAWAEADTWSLDHLRVAATRAEVPRESRAATHRSWGWEQSRESFTRLSRIHPIRRPSTHRESTPGKHARRRGGHQHPILFLQISGCLGPIDSPANGTNLPEVQASYSTHLL